MNFFNSLFGRKSQKAKVYFCVVVEHYGNLAAGQMLDLTADQIAVFPDGVIETFATIQEQVARSRRICRR